MIYNEKTYKVPISSDGILFPKYILHAVSHRKIAAAAAKGNRWRQRNKIGGSARRTAAAATLIPTHEILHSPLRTSTML